jgi:DNA repair protein RAD50
MASINKLSIRGIRAFSPERDETIQFYSPLTMIVGSNGCGKTTIVECLKFLSTGSLPPGSRSGQSIVNDPTMTDSTEVKGAIKMKFTNKAGKSCMVARSLMIARKRSKMEFKQLDGTIKMTNEFGEEVSLSHKCSDLDKHIPELLGVSAAILENVIFCHQEDSSWPLQEGATLKKKFDDIFDSTRYSKLSLLVCPNGLV